MSDPTHWWPGDREGTSGPQGQGDTGGTSIPPGGSPYTSGGYYYPPGTTPSSRGPNGTPPTRQRRASSPRTWTWVAIAVGVAIILATTHRISSNDIILFCVIVPSIILHEVAHGWVALLFGDDTAKRAGRLTLNPIAHIDVLGTVIVPILMILGGYGWFGWAKPVPVNVAKLRSPRNHGVLVSLAGPAVNVLLCVASALVIRGLNGNSVLFDDGQLLARILFFLGLVNVWLAVFNLIPIPPLDGSVLIERMLPASWWPRYLHLRRYTLPLVLVVVVLASIIPDGNTNVIGHFSNATWNWWASVTGL